ncbi:alkaline phosphatase [Aureimonas endophytica]|uniref:Alkaline phosphatase n=1 Tax=Aureimonas endophytica TaxID=2027858 RepID=A0A917E5J5_9HYPH|nr:DedA family protein [Aureimonas endophytica]GGE06779.1 alkaline phosphatase [Aureimonas endophytica]
METLIAPLVAAVLGLISAGGLAGVALLMALESACIPIPSEIIMPFAGYLVSTGRFELWGVALAGAIGCNIGSHVAYMIGAKGGRPLAERWSQHSVFGKRELQLADWFFNKYGAWAMFVGRLLPVVRTFIALPAGIARMNLWTFHLFTFVGSLIWCYALAYIGQRLGENWHDSPALKTAFHVADAVIVLALVAGAIWLVLDFRKKRRARQL